MSDQLGLAEKIGRTRRLPPSRHPNGFYELVLELVNDPLPEVRREAVLFLAHHLRQRSDAQALLDIVAGDTSVEVRRAAADCLGGIFRNTRHQAVSAVLGNIARQTTENAGLRAAANGALKRIQAR